MPESPSQPGPPDSANVTQKLVDVGDAQLYLESAGGGIPPVVVDTGHGGLSLGWREFRDQLCAERTVYLYDRPGYGLSKPTTGAVDAAASADRLDRLLTAAGITEPVVLVGRGVRAICFAARHPGRLAGLVLVDPSPPPPQASTPILMRAVLWLGEAHYRGVARSRATRKGLPQRGALLHRYAEADLSQASTFLASTSYRQAMAAEQVTRRASRRQAAAARIRHDLPIVVITRTAPARQPRRPRLMLNMINWRATWQAHERLVKSYPNAVHLTAFNSSHAVHRDEPEIILAAIRQVLSLAA
jgi:pimeloyl-ACP methyl ester carboxylesterase